MTKHTFFRLITFAILFFLTSCGGKPYIHEDQKYNRGSELFLHGIKDREKVIICHTNLRSIPQPVKRLAQTECQRFKKSAQFRNKALDICPLFTPIAAVFDCLLPNQ